MNGQFSDVQCDSLTAKRIAPQSISLPISAADSGTYSPAYLAGAGAAITPPSSSRCTYIKIGQIINITGVVAQVSTSSTDALVTIDFPQQFPADTSFGAVGVATMRGAAGVISLGGVTASNATTFTITLSVPGANLTPSNLRFSISYRTSA